VITYPIDKSDEVRIAIVDFSANVEDPKAEIVPFYVDNQGDLSISIVIFYDCPTPPLGLFDSFTNIASVSSDLKTRSYLDMILSFNVNASAGFR
jgi:hypothetical protein